MSLTTDLSQLNRANRQKIPQSFLEVMDASTTELTESGMLQSILKVGKVFPSFSLPNHQNQLVSLDNIDADFYILAFYRGGWCPYCNLELKALQDYLPTFEKLNAKLIAISPESPDNSMSTKDRNGLKFGVRIPAWSQNNANRYKTRV